jgi:hypothetical protein
MHSREHSPAGSPWPQSQGMTTSSRFFHSSDFSGPVFQRGTFLDVLWNGNIVTTLRPGYSPWTYDEFNVTVDGNDVVACHGGKAPRGAI